MEPRNPADQLNLQGTAGLARGDLAGAIVSFDRALRVCDLGQAARLHYNRGTARHLAGDLPGALEDFDRAIGISPTFAEAYNNRGMTRQLSGDRAGALTDFDRAIRCAPLYAEAYDNRGMARFAGGDPAGAMLDFNRALELDPRHYRAHNNRGVALQSSGDFPGAIVEFEVAITLDPARAQAYGNRGIARQELACRRDPYTPRPFTDQRQATPPRSDLADVIADFDRAIELTPHHSAAGAYHNRGAARQMAGDLRGALSDFNEALAIDPAHAPTYANRGTAHKALGDLPAARADLDRAVEMTAPAAAAPIYHNRGGVRVLQNDFAGAVADYDIAIGIDPGLLVAYLSRGNARYHQRDATAFLDHIHVLNIAPAFGVQEILQMFINDARHDAAALLRNCERHLRINPSDATALCRRGISRIILNSDLEQAQLDLDRAFAQHPGLRNPLAPLVEAAKMYATHRACQ